MEYLDGLLARMQSGECIASIVLAHENVDKMLDRRRSVSFSSEWMHVYRTVEAAKKSAGTDGCEDPRVRQLREQSYLQSYRRWNNDDLAAFISDDFGLIGDALSLGYHDSRLTVLSSSYESGMFPISVFEPHGRSTKSRNIDLTAAIDDTNDSLHGAPE